MTLNTFIRRPIFSGVISVLIVIMGLVSLVALPVEDISPNDALRILRLLKRQATALF